MRTRDIFYFPTQSQLGTKALLHAFASIWTSLQKQSNVTETLENWCALWIERAPQLPAPTNRVEPCLMDSMRGY